MATLAPDPRDVVTPEAFRVADHLIGVPLARPSRRLGAILIDLLLVAVLVALLDAVAFVIGLVGAFFVFRLSRTKKEGRWYRRFYRHGLGCFGALLTFILLIVAVDTIGGWFGGDDDDDPDADAVMTADSSGNVQLDGLGFTAAAFALRDGVALRNATRPGERDTLADALVERLADEGIPPAQIRAALPDLLADSALPPEAVAAMEAAIETTTARIENRAPRSAEEIRRADAAAAAERAAAIVTADTLAPEDSARVAAADSIRALHARLAQADSELASERAQRVAAEERLESGAVRWILSSVTDELGLGLGWLGLYFTAFTVLGGGQTPGKRVFRLRVIRLDGRPIGWWTALQRFGGYSASVFTGMLGFAEMLWDDNRQALQDKLVATVVIQEPKKDDAATAPLDLVADEGALDDEPPPTLGEQPEPESDAAAESDATAESAPTESAQPSAADDDVEPAR